MIPLCLTLSIIRLGSRVKWSNPGNGVVPSPAPQCCSYWKGSLLVALNYSRQLYYTFYLLWIELLWPENPANTCVWHMEILDRCFDLIRSHQQCIPWSPPVTTECRAETLPLSHQSTLPTSDAKSTSHGNCVVN